MSHAATRADWKLQDYDGPFQAIDCADAFPAEEWTRLQQGLVPESMDDKWFVFFEAPFLHLHRSWTGELVYRLRFDAHEGGARVGEALVSRNVQMTYGPAWEGAFVSFLLRGMMLRQDVSFPAPPSGVPGLPGVFQHSLSGTAFPEAPPADPGGGLRAALARAWLRLTRR
jgi:hypothetical protein